MKSTKCKDFIITLKNILKSKKGKWILPFFIYGFFHLVVEIIMRCQDMIGLFGTNKYSLMGYSSIYMIFIAGLTGSCIAIINQIDRFYKLKMFWQMLICGFIIVGLELATGLFFNRFLGLELWNYSSHVGTNFMNQICLQNSILFTIFSPLFIYLCDYIDWALYRGWEKYNILDNYKELFTWK